MATLTSKEFVKSLEQGNEALFTASEMQVEAFFKSNPSRGALVEHFAGRCANEHANMVEVAERLVAVAPSADPKALKLLARQILDEAEHFDLVAKVIERINGSPVNLQALVEAESKGGSAKGARILENMEANDLIALHTYQFIAEGRAHRVWQKMADVCEDEVISSTYAKIAQDEKMHREFGRMGLEKLLTTPELQTRAAKLADEIRKELYEVSCMNCVEVPAARKLMSDTYGASYLRQ